MSNRDNSNSSIDVKDAQEILEIIGKLDPWQKQLALATLRGAALMSECSEKGA